MLVESIGTTLRELRQLRGLSQKQLAERLDVQQPQISQIESGAYTPSLNVLESFLEALDARLCIELYEGGIHYGSTGYDEAPPGEVGPGQETPGWETPSLG